MIRINLAPGRKKRRSSLVTRAPAGQWVVLVMLGGWLVLAGGGYWLLGLEQETTEALRADAARKNARAAEIREMIDEEGLQARKDRLAQLKVAIEKLKAQRQTPVYVLHELANILTTGEMPDIDVEEQRRIEAADPQSRLAPNWEATSVWITNLKQTGDMLSFEGGARDAADLAEFTRRLRASSRFGNLTHPVYTKNCNKELCYLTWRLDLQVRRWD